MDFNSFLIVWIIVYFTAFIRISPVMKKSRSFICSNAFKVVFLPTLESTNCVWSVTLDLPLSFNIAVSTETHWLVGDHSSKVSTWYVWCIWICIITWSDDSSFDNEVVCNRLGHPVEYLRHTDGTLRWRASTADVNNVVFWVGYHILHSKHRERHDAWIWSYTRWNLMLILNVKEKDVS